MIRVGVGGWSFAPWRNNFYPKGLKRSAELAYAASKLTAIEINGTFHTLPPAASFARWRDETPDGFVFTVKGHRGVVMPRRLADAGEAVGAFLAAGVLELGEKLGPLLWQFAPTRKFDPEDVAAFLALLPREAAARKLRHAIEVRSDTFMVPEFVHLARKHNVAVVFADSDAYPVIGDVTADFIYARLQKSQAEIATGYAPSDLDRFARLAKTWAVGGDPDDLPRVSHRKAPKKARDVFAFVISGAKERAPAAAMGLIERLR